MFSLDFQAALSIEYLVTRELTGKLFIVLLTGQQFAFDLAAFHFALIYWELTKDLLLNRHTQ